MNNNKIENVEPISNMAKLVILDLTNNRINNIESLINLTSLSELHIGFNNISNYNFPPKLREMTIDMNQINIFHQKLYYRVSAKKSVSQLTQYKFFELLRINVIDDQDFIDCELTLKYSSKNIHLNLNNDNIMVENFINKCRSIDLDF